MTLPESRLTDHLSRLQRLPLDAAARERLAHALLDWFTAGWSALNAPAAETLRELAHASLPCAGPAAVFGGMPLQALAAAFANAGIAHLREVDDAHRAAMLHPGVVSISPVLALAAAGALSQRRVADAVIAGYEVALRLGEVLGPRHAGSFHATATAGSVGAAAASAVALGLSPQQLHHAMGIAATQAAGLWQFADDEAHESKSLHPAFAVRNGMMAAFAARAGLPGARAFVTGRRALYALLAGDGPLAALDGDLDDDNTRLRLHSATIKAWPCCAQLFTALDATRALLDEHQPEVAQIESIEVEIFTHALKIAAVQWPTRPSETPFCLRYVLATLLQRGDLSITDMEAPELDASALKRLAARVHVRTSDEFQRAFPDKRPCRVTITLQDGRKLEATRELRRGDPEDPFTWAQLQARLRRFAPHTDDVAAARLARWCEAFTEADRDSQRCHPEPALFGT